MINISRASRNKQPQNITATEHDFYAHQAQREIRKLTTELNERRQAEVGVQVGDNLGTDVSISASKRSPASPPSTDPTCKCGRTNSAAESPATAEQSVKLESLERNHLSLQRYRSLAGPT